MENTKNTKGKFSGILGSYTIVETEDNSITLHSEYFDENCHSSSGANAETIYNYFEGCEVIRENKASREKFTIFEVGFGLGIGAKVTYEGVLESRENFEFISTEIDEGLVLWTIENDRCEIFKSLKKITQGELTYYKSTNNNFTLIILIGDARVTTDQARSNALLKNVNAIYQDAFSPKKNAPLWTTEWFALLKEISEDDVVMSTYSSLGRIRKSLLNAGWSIFKRQGFASKRSSTIAKLHGKMDQEFIANVLRSPGPALEDSQL